MRLPRFARALVMALALCTGFAGAARAQAPDPVPLQAAAARAPDAPPVQAQVPAPSHPGAQVRDRAHAQASGHGAVTHGATEPGPSIPQGRPALVAGELRTERFVILYTARSEGSAKALAERVEATRDAFRDVFGREWPGVTEIRLAMGREEMEALSLAGSRVPKWAEALAWPRHNVILVDALSLLKPSGEVTLRHELSHVALGQLSNEWPRWFQEGVAMYLTGDRFSVTQYAAMFRAVTQERLFDFTDLSESWPDHPADVEIAYAQSVTFVAHLVERYGRERLGELVDHVQAGASFEVAFARAFLTSLGVEQESWAKALPSRYSWMPILTGGSVVWSAAALILVAGWWRRRRVKAQRLAEMAEQEAEEAARTAAERLSAALNSVPPPEAGTISDPHHEDPSWAAFEDAGARGGTDDFEDEHDLDAGHDGDDDADFGDLGEDGPEDDAEDSDVLPEPRSRRLLH